VHCFSVQRSFTATAELYLLMANSAVGNISFYQFRADSLGLMYIVVVVLDDDDDDDFNAE